ncbi:MAG TPA: pseudouridine synthase [Blastocatellia bacterium]|nr:pseudouridine synthase [Blastocatellia bacterium]
MAEKCSSIAPKPAKIYLPKFDRVPATVLDYLVERFPGIEKETWLERMNSGKVVDEESIAVNPATPYRYGKTIYYFREVADELQIPFQETILFQNDDLLVADKPHFLPVTPTGPAVNECMLSRLQRRTGIQDLSPIHRLDRDTAGLVLFSTVKKTRHLYHKLFVEQKVAKRYLSVAPIPTSSDVKAGTEWTVENRLGPGEPWFRMKVIDGPVNARTRIVLKEVCEDRGLFELCPATGKKHQLRVHMAAIGFPIVNDCFYPELNQFALSDFSRPLQLLAKRIEFHDPVTDKDFVFQSIRELSA